MEFYWKVSDQLYALGDSGEKESLLPRMSDWLAVCVINDVPQEQRAVLIDDARFMLNLVTGRQEFPGVQSLPLKDLYDDV